MSNNEQAFDSILVALDGSQPSKVAASLAIQIAKQEKLLVRGIFVADEELIFDDKRSLEKELGYKPGEVLLSDERAQLLKGEGEAALRWLEERGQENEVPVQGDLMFGGMPDIIINQSDKVRLLALGRQGCSHNDDTAHLGGHFRAIAHQTSVPLLVGGETLSPIRRILLAYDGSLPAKHALTWAGLLQHIWHCHLLIISVAEEAASSRWLAEMEEQINENRLQNHRFIGCTGVAPTQIVAAAAEEKADMIVMGGYQHGALREWLTGSTLDQVLRNTTLPLFVADKRED
jgi:nucleotide-binding universal stress UspA family protein